MCIAGRQWIKKAEMSENITPGVDPVEILISLHVHADKSESPLGAFWITKDAVLLSRQ